MYTFVKRQDYKGIACFISLYFLYDHVYKIDNFSIRKIREIHEFFNIFRALQCLLHCTAESTKYSKIMNFPEHFPEFGCGKWAVLHTRRVKVSIAFFIYVFIYFFLFFGNWKFPGRFVSSVFYLVGTNGLLALVGHFRN